MSKILALDEEPQMRQLLECGFSRDGREVEAVGDYDSALERVAGGGFDLLVLDVGVSRVRWQRRGRASGRGWARHALSVPEKVEHQIRSACAGANDFVEKPFAIEELRPGSTPCFGAPTSRPARLPCSDSKRSWKSASRRLVVLGREALHLTLTEYGLFEVLVRMARGAGRSRSRTLLGGS